MPGPDLPKGYPQWVQDYFNAKTEDIPGFFGDWWDIGVHVEESEDAEGVGSITVYDEQTTDEYKPVPLATFYGNQYRRRAALVKYMSEVIVAKVAALAIAGKEIGDAYRMSAELPLRLTFGAQYGNETFGGPWQ